MHTSSLVELQLEKDIKNLSSIELKVWICNDCHNTHFEFIPPNFSFHNTGRCTNCYKSDEISNPYINHLILEKGDHANNDYGLIIRNSVPSDVLEYMKNGNKERFFFSLFEGDNIYKLATEGKIHHLITERRMENEWKMKMGELPRMCKSSIDINFNIENDILVDVLNDSNIPGLSHAAEEKGKIAIHIVDSWTLDSAIKVKSICSEFGYECFIVE